MQLSKRNSSYELLRIISMFFIVMHHYAFYGTFDRVNFIPSHINSLRINLLLLFLGKVAVDIFVIIGAYFLSEKSFKFRRPVSLGITTILYSLLIFSVLKLFFPSLIWNNENWLQAVLPFPSPTGYWFVDSYLFMLLMMPVLNLCLSKFSLLRIKQMIGLIFVFWSILPTFTALFNYKSDFSAENFGYSSGTFFLLIYIIGGYIRKNKNTKSRLLKETLISIILIFVGIIYIWIFSRVKSLFYLTSIMAYLFNPLALLLAISIFKCFTQFNFHSKLVNYLSGSMFGVYLLHENTFLRPLIWKRFFSSVHYSAFPLEYLLYGLEISAIVFIVCLVADILIRRLLFQRLISKLTDVIDHFIIKIIKHGEV